MENSRDTSAETGATNGYRSPLTSPIPSKQSSKAGMLALWGGVGFVIIGLLVGMFWFWNEAQTAKTEAESAKQQVKTAQDAKTAAEKKLSEATKTTKSTPTTSAVPAPAAVKPATDEEAIAVALSAYSNAITGMKTTKNDVRIATNGPKKLMNDTFANAVIGQISGNVLKKVDGTWVVVRYGQDPLTKDTVIRFGIPADIATPNA